MKNKQVLKNDQLCQGILDTEAWKSGRVKEFFYIIT